MHVLCHGAHLVLGEAPERVLRQHQVGIEVARSGFAGQRRQVGGVPPGPYEIERVVQRACFEVPRRLSAQHPAGHVMHGVGNERRGETTSTSPRPP